MSSYSPLSKIIVQDFRSIGKAEVSFEESPIVVLAGGNDAGKSSIIKAFEVCALHYNQKGQKRYIKTGAPFFGVVVQLTDGTSIIRMKSADGINKYEVRYPDGTKWTTGKISEGLPVQVSNLMGMVQEPETGEYLQVRTYEDQLLMVYTPASTNYKVMYDALKVGQITRAVRKGIEESNNLQYDIVSNYKNITALTKSVNDIRIVDIESLVGVRNSMRELRGQLEKIGNAINIKNEINRTQNELGVLRLIDTYKLEEVDEYKAGMFNQAISGVNSISEISKKLNELRELEDLGIIKTDHVVKLGSAVESLEQLRKLNKDGENFESLSTIEELDVTVAVEMNSAMSDTEKLKDMTKESNKYNEVDKISPLDYEVDVLGEIGGVIKLVGQLKETEEQLRGLDVMIEENSSKLKAAGVGFETCPNCGTEVLIDYSNMENSMEAHNGSCS